MLNSIRGNDCWTASSNLWNGFQDFHKDLDLVCTFRWNKYFIQLRQTTVLITNYNFTEFWIPSEFSILTYDRSDRLDTVWYMGSILHASLLWYTISCLHLFYLNEISLPWTKGNVLVVSAGWPTGYIQVKRTFLKDVSTFLSRRNLTHKLGELRRI